MMIKIKMSNKNKDFDARLNQYLHDFILKEYLNIVLRYVNMFQQCEKSIYFLRLQFLQKTLHIDFTLTLENSEVNHCITIQCKIF